MSMVRSIQTKRPFLFSAKIDDYSSSLSPSSSSNAKTSSTVFPKTLAISIASFSEGLYFPFSSLPKGIKNTLHIRVLAALQGAVAPGLNVDIGFLVQLADGGGGHLAAP